MSQDNNKVKEICCQITIFFKFNLLSKIYIMDEEQLKSLFGANVRTVRKNYQLTQEQLAELIGLEPANVSKMENGTHFPSLKTLVKLVDVFGLDISNLFTGNFTRENKKLEKILYDIKNLDEQEFCFLQDVIASLKKFRDK